MVKKAFPIAKTLYSSYLLLFLFDDATSHFVHVKVVFQAKDMNKVSGGKQPILRNEWFDWNDV